VKKEKLDQKMSLGHHLKDLKKSLSVIAVTYVAAFVVCYIYAPETVSFMININTDYTFVQSDVTELLAQYIKVALIAALVISSPIIIWQVHRFVSPGLTKSEDVKFLMILIGGLIFFVIGDVFCYLVVIPFTLQFFLGLNAGLASTAAITALIDLEKYISYLMALMLAFGCIFEMPVITAILASIGLIRPKGMASARKIVIVVCFVVGATITPPDVVSQCLVALPMVLLYQVSIWVCAVISGRRDKRLRAQGIDPDAERSPKVKSSRWQRAVAQVEKKDAEKKRKQQV